MFAYEILSLHSTGHRIDKAYCKRDLSTVPGYTEVEGERGLRSFFALISLTFDAESHIKTTCTPQKQLVLQLGLRQSNTSTLSLHGKIQQRKKRITQLLYGQVLTSSRKAKFFFFFSSSSPLDWGCKLFSQPPSKKQQQAAGPSGALGG